MTGEQPDAQLLEQWAGVLAVAATRLEEAADEADKRWPAGVWRGRAYEAYAAVVGVEGAGFREAAVQWRRAAGELLALASGEGVGRDREHRVALALDLLAGQARHDDDLLDGEVTAERLAAAQTAFQVTSFDSDWRFDTRQSQWMAEQLEACGVKVDLAELASPFGHDSFLLQPPGYHERVAGFLEA